jgi:hypothetical protein
MIDVIIHDPCHVPFRNLRSALIRLGFSEIEGNRSRRRFAREDMTLEIPKCGSKIVSCKFVVNILRKLGFAISA